MHIIDVGEHVSISQSNKLNHCQCFHTTEKFTKEKNGLFHLRTGGPVKGLARQTIFHFEDWVRKQSASQQEIKGI